MACDSNYSLADVIAIANIHPFYSSDVRYPPDAHSIRAARDQASMKPAEPDLQAQPLLRKNDLYTTIQRLVDDTSPQNTYRHSIYASITGGGFGSKPLFFATDVHENRRNRANFGRFLQATGLIAHGDWVVTLHTAGELYRSLDLTLEILENAGASVLGAGNRMSPADVIRIIRDYHVNILTGDSSQVVQIAHYISSLSSEERSQLKIEKIIYTSETLTTAQRAYIKSILGPIKICSVLASAETGPFALSSPGLGASNPVTGCEDFVFDTRSTIIEILPLSISVDGSAPKSMPEGEQGIIAQTCLTRLRNPVVRYVTGDIGSLHPLSEQARSLVPEAYWPHLRVLRLQGRDGRFSFEWDGEYIEFQGLTSLMHTAEYGILQWQVILDKMEPSLEASLEIRLLCSSRSENVVAEEVLVDRIRTFFHAYPGNEHRFQLKFLKDLGGFELSSTGRKVVKFINRFT